MCIRDRSKGKGQNKERRLAEKEKGNCRFHATEWALSERPKEPAQPQERELREPYPELQVDETLVR
eukprot:11229215-Prorocentrum_lima.AAC.1